MSRQRQGCELGYPKAFSFCVSADQQALLLVAARINALPIRQQGLPLVFGWALDRSLSLLKQTYTHARPLLDQNLILKRRGYREDTPRLRQGGPQGGNPRGNPWGAWAGGQPGVYPGWSLTRIPPGCVISMLCCCNCCCRACCRRPLLLED